MFFFFRRTCNFFWAEGKLKALISVFLSVNQLFATKLKAERRNKKEIREGCL
jgi:hypothetical protein